MYGTIYGTPNAIQRDDAMAFLLNGDKNPNSANPYSDVANAQRVIDDHNNALRYGHHFAS